MRVGIGSGGLEAVDFGLPGAGGHGAVEVAVGDGLGVEFGAEEGEERRELGEDEDAVAVVDGFGEEFGEGVQLRGVGEVCRGVFGGRTA